MLPEVAVIVVEPVVVAEVTRPFEPWLLLIVASPRFDEVQVTEDVIIAVPLFE